MSAAVLLYIFWGAMEMLKMPGTSVKEKAGKKG